MKRYLLSIEQPDGPPPSPEFLGKVMEDVAVFNAELRASGAWVFNAALAPASSATALRLQDGEVIMTDGPYVEGKEHLGGVVIVKAPDLDKALEWARKLARAIPLPIEVRPFQGEAD